LWKQEKKKDPKNSIQFPNPEKKGVNGKNETRDNCRTCLTEEGKKNCKEGDENLIPSALLYGKQKKGKRWGEMGGAYNKITLK